MGKKMKKVSELDRALKQKIPNTPSIFCDNCRKTNWGSGYDDFALRNIFNSCKKCRKLSNLYAQFFHEKHSALWKNMDEEQSRVFKEIANDLKHYAALVNRQQQELSRYKSFLNREGYHVESIGDLDRKKEYRYGFERRKCPEHEK